MREEAGFAQHNFRRSNASNAARRSNYNGDSLGGLDQRHAVALLRDSIATERQLQLSDVSVDSCHIRQPPNAAGIVNSLRSIGYSFNTAVADIIDNSITAQATVVELLVRTEPLWYAIVDNGGGMSYEQLLDAMRHGTLRTVVQREPNDLGRFGLGLKTASLSQCRRLTVVSKREGRYSAARWDLDDVERTNDWLLELPSTAELLAQPYCSSLHSYESGTAVIWEKLDRALAGEADQGSSIQRLAVEASNHVALVFHRFIERERGDFSISFNKRVIHPLDPFLRKHANTLIAGQEKRLVYGSPIVVRAYILPHINKLASGDVLDLGGRSSLRDAQGFYVYRNFRLIIWGTWFRLIGRHELSRLARVQVDITNDLDEKWNLDVKKSAAYPPQEVRDILRQIVAIVAERSAAVFRERRREPKNAGRNVALWDRDLVREGLRYTINRDHPLVSALLETSSNVERTDVISLLRSIELALPTRAIYIDQANDCSINQANDNELVADLQSTLENLLTAIPSEESRQQLIRSLLLIEPFSLYPQITRSLQDGKVTQ